jgi:hypothetical protein
MMRDCMILVDYFAVFTNERGVEDLNNWTEVRWPLA